MVGVKGKVSYSWEHIPHLKDIVMPKIYMLINILWIQKKGETLLRIKKTHLQESRLSDLYNYSVVVLGWPEVFIKMTERLMWSQRWDVFCCTLGLTCGGQETLTSDSLTGVFCCINGNCLISDFRQGKEGTDLSRDGASTGAFLHAIIHFIGHLSFYAWRTGVSRGK